LNDGRQSLRGLAAVAVCGLLTESATPRSWRPRRAQVARDRGLTPGRRNRELRRSGFTRAREDGRARRSRGRGGASTGRRAPRSMGLRRSSPAGAGGGATRGGELPRSGGKSRATATDRGHLCGGRHVTRTSLRNALRQAPGVENREIAAGEFFNRVALEHHPCSVRPPPRRPAGRKGRPSGSVVVAHLCSPATSEETP